MKNPFILVNNTDQRWKSKVIRFFNAHWGCDSDDKADLNVSAV